MSDLEKHDYQEIKNFDMKRLVNPEELQLNVVFPFESKRTGQPSEVWIPESRLKDKSPSELKTLAERTYEAFRRAEEWEERRNIQYVDEKAINVAKELYKIVFLIVTVNCATVYTERLSREDNEESKAEEHFLESLAQQLGVSSDLDLTEAAMENADVLFDSYIKDDEKYIPAFTESLYFWVGKQLAAAAILRADEETDGQDITDEAWGEVFQRHYKVEIGGVKFLFQSYIHREAADILENDLKPVEMPLKELRVWAGVTYLEAKANHVGAQASGMENFKAELAAPSNPVVMMGFRGIWNGGHGWPEKNFWALNQDDHTAQATYYPRDGGNITVMVDPREASAVWTLEEIDKYLQDLSPFTSDIALAVLASLSRASAPMLEPVIISSEDIRKLKGLELRGAKRIEFDQRIAEEMKKLQHLRFNVMQVKAATPEDRKGQRWQGQSWRNDRLFDIVDIEDWQDDLFGGQERVGIKWSVRAGQWAFYFLNNDTRRWVTNIAAELFTLSHRDDRRAEQLAKKIGYFIAFNGWKELKGQQLRWTRKTLLENIGESIERESKPSRLIEALDEALKLLLHHKIVAGIKQQTCEDKKSKGWIGRHLQGEVEFINRNQLVSSIETARKNSKGTKRKTRLKHTSTSAPKLDVSKLRQVREGQDLNQEAVARDLGISRVYYSGIENGKREPSAELLQKIQKWMNVNVTR